MFSKSQKNKIQFKNKYYKVKKLFNYNKMIKKKKFNLSKKNKMKRLFMIKFK